MTLKLLRRGQYTAFLQDERGFVHTIEVSGECFPLTAEPLLDELLRRVLGQGASGEGASSTETTRTPPAP